MATVIWAIPRERREENRGVYHLYRMHLDSNKEKYFVQQCRVLSENYEYHHTHLYGWPSGPPIGDRCTRCHKLARAFESSL